MRLGDQPDDKQLRTLSPVRILPSILSHNPSTSELTYAIGYQLDLVLWNFSKFGSVDGIHLPPFTLFQSSRSSLHTPLDLSKMTTC